MLWPVILPLKVTFLVLAGLVLLAMLMPRPFQWKRGKVFVFASLVACLAFVPSCVGIMSIIDAQRFGVFQYETYGQVDDFRVERFLPPKTSDITVAKTAMGHRAKYSISEQDLVAFLDKLWNDHGDQSVSPRSEDEPQAVSEEEFTFHYEELGWPSLENAVIYEAPFAPNGSGATYFFDRDLGIAYHRASYW